MAKGLSPKRWEYRAMPPAAVVESSLRIHPRRELRGFLL
jgi:hypothetical protein